VAAHREVHAAPVTTQNFFSNEDLRQVLATVTRIAGLKADITLAVTQSNHAINKELLGDIVEVKSRAQESQLSAVLAWLSTLNFRQMQKEVFERLQANGLLTIAPSAFGTRRAVFECCGIMASLELGNHFTPLLLLMS
jgi:hypothetical protein